MIVVNPAMIQKHNVNIDGDCTRIWRLKFSMDCIDLDYGEQRN